MDILETLQLIQQTAVEAAGAKQVLHLVHPDQEPAHVYLAVSQSGNYERVEAAPRPRDHQLVTLEQAIRFAELKGTAEQTVVWYDREGIVIVVDDATRRDLARVKLRYTPQLQTLLTIEKDRSTFDQREFRRLLKVSLAGCRTDDVLLRWVEGVRWNSTVNSGGQIKHQRESLGRDIDQMAVSDVDLGECPEQLRLEVRVFDDPSLTSRWTVVCDVEVVVSDNRFRLTPLPLELHNAIENELSYVGEQLTTHVKCPVFRGKP